MDKSVQKTLIIMAGILIIAIFAITSFNSIVPQTNTVAGNGQATIKVIPDLVGVYFNVETTGETSKNATEENSLIVDKLTTQLTNKGFTKEQIQTTSFNVFPDYEWDDKKRIEKGFRATHSIKVELLTEDSEIIGEVIDAGVNAGAGISFINFELSKELENEYKAQALSLAAQDARIKAQAIATGLGKNLGKLVSTSDSGFNYMPFRVFEAEGVSMDAALAKESTTNITPGEQEIFANVKAVYKLR